MPMTDTDCETNENISFRSLFQFFLLLSYCIHGAHVADVEACPGVNNVSTVSACAWVSGGPESSGPLARPAAM